MKNPWDATRRPKKKQWRIKNIFKTTPFKRRRRRRRQNFSPVMLLGIVALLAFQYLFQDTYERLGNSVTTETRRITRSYAASGNTHNNYNRDDVITCYAPRIVDGDTLECSGIKIRLHAIDAPEMAGHCRPGRRCVSGDPVQSKAYLEYLSRGHVSCTPVTIDSYGRTVADCESGGHNLSCAMVAAGHAVERYGRLSC